MDPATIDYIIISVFELLKVLGKQAKGEPITDEDLKLESFEETVAKIKADIAKTKG